MQLEGSAVTKSGCSPIRVQRSEVVPGRLRGPDVEWGGLPGGLGVVERSHLAPDHPVSFSLGVLEPRDDARDRTAIVRGLWGCPDSAWSEWTVVGSALGDAGVSPTARRLRARCNSDRARRIRGSEGARHPSLAADRRRLSIDADQSRRRAARRERGQSTTRRESVARRLGSLMRFLSVQPLYSNR